MFASQSSGSSLHYSSLLLYKARESITDNNTIVNDKLGLRNSHNDTQYFRRLNRYMDNSYPFCWGNYFIWLMVTKIVYSSMFKWVPIWLSFPSISQCRMSESCTLITVQLLQHLDHAMSYAQLLCYCTGLLYHIKYAKVWYLTEFSSFRIAF